MARRFSLVLFDVGSTLLHFDGILSDLVRQADQVLCGALNRLGYPLAPEIFVPGFRSRLQAYFQQRDVDFREYTAQNVLRKYLAEMGFADVPVVHLKTALREMYRVTEAHWMLEPDALPTLIELKYQRYHLGLISNAADGDDLRQLVERNGLSPYFEQILVSAEVGYRKPHPCIFQQALDFFGTAPGQVVMVGDSLGADVLGAKNCGIASVWITRRAHTADKLANENTVQPDRTIHALDELPGVLAAW